MNWFSVAHPLQSIRKGRGQWNTTPFKQGNPNLILITLETWTCLKYSLSIFSYLTLQFKWISLNLSLYLSGCRIPRRPGQASITWEGEQDMAAESAAVLPPPHLSPFLKTLTASQQLYLLPADPVLGSPGTASVPAVQLLYCSFVTFGTRKHIQPVELGSNSLLN